MFLQLHLDFRSQRCVGLGSPAASVIPCYRKAVAGSLRQPNVSGNNGCEDLAGKVPAHFLRNLCGKIGASVKHG